MQWYLRTAIRTDGGLVKARAVQTLTMEWKFEAFGKTYSIALFFMVTFVNYDIASISLLSHAILPINIAP